MSTSRLTPEQRSLRAQIAAHARWKNGGNQAQAEVARRTILARFEHEVDPDNTLDPEERARRAEHARKEYFKKLAFASSKARRARAGAA